MKTLSIRGTNRADLLAIPPVVLGYHPQDSLVVLALQGGVLMMSARLCLDWYLTHYEATVAQMSAAIENVPGCRSRWPATASGSAPPSRCWSSRTSSGTTSWSTRW